MRTLKPLFRSFLLIQVAIALSWIFPMSAFSQVQVSAKLDTNILLIGDQTKLTLQIQYPSNYLVQFPLLSDTLNGLEIVSASAIDTLKSAQPPSITLKQTFNITGFDSGYFVVPPFLFQYQTGGNNPADTILTEPLVITINSIDVDTSLAIKDIKSPLDVPFSWKEALPYILWTVAALLILGLLYFLWKRRKKPVAPVRKVPTRPAHVIAFEELDKLRTEKLWETGLIKEYQIRLTDILRTYLEHRFNMRAMEQTTDEIMIDFRKVNRDTELTTELEHTLKVADLAKFAKVMPVISENQKGLEFGYRFVKVTQTELKVENEVQDTNGPLEIKGGAEQ